MGFSLIGRRGVMLDFSFAEQVVVVRSMMHANRSSMLASGGTTAFRPLQCSSALRTFSLVPELHPTALLFAQAHTQMDRDVGHMTCWVSSKFGSFPSLAPHLLVVLR